MTSVVTNSISLSKRLKIWFIALRPYTLVISIGPIIAANSLAFKEGYFNFSIALLSLFLGIFLHIGTNLSNDYFDFIKGADPINKYRPLSPLQQNFLNLKEMKLAYVLSFFCSFLIGVFLAILTSYYLLIFVPVCIFFGLLYTAGSKPLSYIGLGDILVFAFFGPVLTLGSYFLQTHKISFYIIILSIIFGLLIDSILIINNLRDLSSDKKANKKTTVVLLGKNFGQILYVSTIIISCALHIFLMTSNNPIYLSELMIFLFIPFVPLFLKIYNYKNSRILNVLLERTTKIIFLYSIFISIFILL
jgi:1,4-dihydroxy-2-naphthoate polyprenyltransferase